MNNLDRMRVLSGIEERFNPQDTGRKSLDDKAIKRFQAMFQAAVNKGLGNEQAFGIVSMNMRKAGFSHDDRDKMYDMLLDFVTETEAEMQTQATDGVDSADAEFDLSQESMSESKDKKIYYDEFLSKYDDLIHSGMPQDEAFSKLNYVMRSQGYDAVEISGLYDYIQRVYDSEEGAYYEGAKVDRMVNHIAKSERDAGKSDNEAEDIAWATANKRGYLDNKNKKVHEDEDDEMEQWIAQRYALDQQAKKETMNGGLRFVNHDPVKDELYISTMHAGPEHTVSMWIDGEKDDGIENLDEPEEQINEVASSAVDDVIRRLYALDAGFVDEDDAWQIVSDELYDQGYNESEVETIMHAAEAEMYSDDEDDDGEFELDEAKPRKKKSTIDPEEVGQMMSLGHPEAVARAQEILAASTTSDEKKRFLANRINQTRNTQGVVKLLYDMILAGEGNSVVGSRYSKRFNEDLNNGYDDVHNLDGEDYFPDGADSPVVDATGPSGARHGDNPEQKKMEVTELHKELVYGYRSFLKESGKRSLNESVEDLNIADIEGGVEDTGNGLEFKGRISFTADVPMKNGQEGFIEYWLSIHAYAPVTHHIEPSPRWSAKGGKADLPKIKSLKLTGSKYVILDGEEMYAKDLPEYLDNETVQSLTNPEIYVYPLSDLFDKRAEEFNS